MTEKECRVCSRCIMDESDTAISFDKDGVCNHCMSYDSYKRKHILPAADKKNKLEKVIAEIKLAGRNKRYDCIIGVSGGVDSSYVAYLAKKWGVRGLLVHLDNGWDSELAVKNVENIVKYTGFDLYTLVIDWEEFRDLQRSFFAADVIDLELLSDHAIFATVFRLARKYNIRYLLGGENFETEAIMPTSWNWRKSDSVNIKDIHKKYGQKKIKTFPFMSTLKRVFYQYSGVAKSIPVLNYLEYDKEQAMKVIESEMGWKYYGGKHYESIFTRFYQGVILPRKFNIDKRKAHFSTLINSNQMTRSEAVEHMKAPTYPVDLQNLDFDLICKKLGFTKVELEEYLDRGGKSHTEYKSDQRVVDFIQWLSGILRR